MTPRQKMLSLKRGFLLAIAAIIAMAGLPPPARAELSSIPPVSALNKMENARAMGMGGAGVALGGDAGLVWLNPASAFGTNPSTISFTGQQGVFGETIGQAVSTFKQDWGVLILSAGYYNAGDTKLTASDFTSRTVNTQRDFVGGAGFAASPMAGSPLGAAIKYLDTQLAEEFRSGTITADIGGQFAISDSVKTGVAIRNIGGSYRYAGDNTPAPTSITLGLAVLMRASEGIGTLITGDDVAILAADTENRLNASLLSVQAGIEYRTLKILSIRVGTRQNPGAGISSYSAGLGLMFKAPVGGKETMFRIDYAYQFGEMAFVQPHILGLTIEFGGVSRVSGDGESAVPAESGIPDQIYEAAPSMPIFPENILTTPPPTEQLPATESVPGTPPNQPNPAP